MADFEYDDYYSPTDPLASGSAGIDPNDPPIDMPTGGLDTMDTPLDTMDTPLDTFDTLDTEVPVATTTRRSSTRRKVGNFLSKAKRGLDTFITLGDRVRASDNLLLKIAMVSLTLVGLFGFGDYNPPRFITYLTNEAPFLKVFSQWVLLVILAYQGLGGQDIWLSVLSTYVFFFFFELVKVIENFFWPIKDEEEKAAGTNLMAKIIAFVIATVIVIIYYLFRRYSASKTA